MKINVRYLLVLSLIAEAACKDGKIANGSAGVGREAVFSKGDKINNDNFTGNAYLQPLIAADSLNATAVGSVTFEAGARTRWHIHPAGQILLVMDGVGYYQEKGQAKKVLRRGEAIKCPPGIPHWHGASRDTGFVQVAITNNQKGATVWLEAVSDEEYNGGN